ncbi:MAG: hypothetical protein LBC92_02840 [Rickettsiales bacterium]|jgi:hypothetical protein|nr:hypothetical protein [Rickettsiales bacterium]
MGGGGEEGKLTQAEVDEYLKSNRILFVKIADLPDYKGTREDEKCAYNSVKQLKNQIFGKLPIFEIENFLPHYDGYVYGFVETKMKGDESHTRHECNKAVNSINIERMGASSDDNKIDNCLVVFVSLGTAMVVGYYKDATVYRERQKHSKYVYEIQQMTTDSNGGRNILYNFKTKKKNAILLEGRFSVSLEELHYGQSFQKYVDDKNREYVRKYILKKIIQTIKIKDRIRFHFRETHFKNTFFDYVYFIVILFSILACTYILEYAATIKGMLTVSICANLLVLWLRLLSLFGYRYFIYKRKILIYEYDKYNSVLIDKKVEEYPFKNYNWERLILYTYVFSLFGIFEFVSELSSFLCFLTFFRTKNYILTDGIMIKTSVSNGIIILFFITITLLFAVVKLKFAVVKLKLF